MYRRNQRSIDDDFFTFQFQLMVHFDSLYPLRSTYHLITFYLLVIKVSEKKAGILVHTYNNEKMVVICILGIGRLGGNIAGDLAFNGHSVRVWDADKNALDKLHQRLDYERKRLKDDKLITLPKFLVSLRIYKINSKVNLSKTHPFLRVMYFAFQIWRKHWQRRNLSLKLSMKIWETRNVFLKVSIEVCIHHWNHDVSSFKQNSPSIVVQKWF